ncbi:MAG TPA: DUF4382 domain-containing protein, partial [Longimicrobiales bacterium]|nr:DUF4382 domain-containing protein [Longimicrobiales bacterium]
MNWAKLRATTLLPCMLLALGASACDEPGVGLDDRAQVVRETGTTVRVLLTDAPADYIGSALVDIGVVELVPTDGGPHVVLSEDGTDGFVDLLELQNAATTPIAEADIEPGSFSQLRLVIEAARVELAEGYEFRDGSTEMELFVPSGAQTGIKLNLHSGEDDGPLEIIPGETVLVLDFDVSRSYVLRGNPETPAGIHGVNFKPTLRVTAFDVAASISGTVSTTLGGVSVGGLMVTATPVDEGTVVGYQTEAGTTTTAGDGTYTIHFLVPGTYEVMVDLDPGLGTVPESNLVELDHSEDETGVDFEIIDVTGSIAGTATTEVDGASVAELVVTATPADETLETLETSTAADGTYLFESVVPGLYTVTIEPGEDLLAEPES